MSERWWINDGVFGNGRDVLGPFESRELALKVREYVEAVEGDGRFSVRQESAAVSP